MVTLGVRERRGVCVRAGGLCWWVCRVLVWMPPRLGRVQHAGAPHEIDRGWVGGG